MRNIDGAKPLYGTLRRHARHNEAVVTSFDSSTERCCIASSIDERELTVKTSVGVAHLAHKYHRAIRCDCKSAFARGIVAGVGIHRPQRGARSVGSGEGDIVGITCACRVGRTREQVLTVIADVGSRVGRTECVEPVYGVAAGSCHCNIIVAGSSVAVEEINPRHFGSSGKCLRASHKCRGKECFMCKNVHNDMG